MSDRFTQKQRQLRRRTFRRVLLVVAAVAVLGFVVWVGWFSSWFAAENVRITGTEFQRSAAVNRIADAPLGEPLLRIDTDRIEQAVATLPIIEKVTVSRQWPHTIHIAVTERTATAWVSRAGQPWAVDRFGVVYRELKSEPGHLPQLRVDVPLDGAESASLSAAAEVADELRTRGRAIFERIDGIDADTKDSITLDLGDVTIAWGSSGSTDEKLRVLRALMEVEANVYDVSAPDNPTTRS